MFKSVFAATAALSMSAGAAFAGAYVNVEANSGWTGSEYGGTVTDAHVGTKVLLVSLLPGMSKVVLRAFVSPDGGETDTVPSGKAGLGIALTDALGAYGEVSFIGSGDDDIDRGYGAKQESSILSDSLDSVI